MKFIVDMPLSPVLSGWLTAHGHDAIHASEVGLSCSPDSDIMAYAFRENRVILTADLDFPRLLAQQSGNRVGLILYRGGNYNSREMVRGIERVFQAIPLNELPYSIIVIEKNRIRRKRVES